MMCTTLGHKQLNIRTFASILLLLFYYLLFLPRRLFLSSSPLVLSPTFIFTLIAISFYISVFSIYLSIGLSELLSCHSLSLFIL